jgi:Tol biopolymer transport system component
MLRRRLPLVVLVLAAAASTLAVAAPLQGPRLAVMRLKHAPSGLEIATLDPSGGGYRRILTQRMSKRFGALGSLAWSADGSLLAYSRRQKDGHRVIAVVPATGKGRPRVVPGTRGGEWPVFSPDGRSLAFARYRVKGRRPSGFPAYESSSVWIVGLDSGHRRQLTRWGNDLWQYPSSFSPDGSTLLLTRLDFLRSVENEIVALRFDGRTSGLLVGEGDEPLYSPDGTKIVFTDWHEQRVWSPRHGKWVFRPTSDLYVVDADGSRRRRLTHTPSRIEMLGGWDPTGERIAYSQFRGFPFQPGSTGAVMEINADGTCPTTVLSKDGVSFFSPVWQPGAGGSAGPIAC